MKSNGFSQIIILIAVAALVIMGIVYYVMYQTEGTVYIPRLMQLNSPSRPDMDAVENEVQNLDLGDLNSEFKDIDKDTEGL